MKNFKYLYQTYSNNELDTIDIYEHDSSELKFFIAIDSLKNGPAVGACRFINNTPREKALLEVCKMARTMTEKNIIAGVPFGGGKAFVYYSAVEHKKMLRLFAEALNDLNGLYYTTNDIGISIDDIVYMRNYTLYAKGSKYLGKEIPATAYGVYLSLKTAAKNALGIDSLSCKSVSMQGLGNVGLPLMEFLLKDNCSIVVNDINKEKLQTFQQKYGFNITEDDFVTQDVDFVVPCAIGGVINDSNIEKITAKIICGGANNQLSYEELDTYLYKKGILFIPDMLANCSGMIDLFCEGEHYCQEYVFNAINPISRKVEFFINESKKRNLSVNACLREWLRQRI